MKKIHLGLIGIATLFLTACTVGTSSDRYIDKDNHTSEDDSITPVKVTFDFNGGTYDGSAEQVEFNDVKPTSYWKYVKARLTGTITPPVHNTFEGFSFAKDDPKIIDDSYVIKEDIIVYAQYKAIPGESCTVNWVDGETTEIIKTETYFEGEKPELKDIPYHDGKTFDHWEPEITPIAHKELGGSREHKAVYVPIKTIYNVTLDYYGDGSEKHTQKVLNGECAVEPKITKEGYELKNWSYVDGGEGEFDFSTPITKNGIKIEANWIKLEPFLQSVIMSVTITESTTISFSCDKDDKYMVEWGDGALDIENHHDYQSGTYLINIFGSGGLKSFKLTGGQPCLSEVNIANIESLGDSAFQSCSALTSITIPSSVTSIGNDAFSGCSKLQTVTFAGESKLESIGESAFQSCSALTSITIPSGVTSIGGSAFYSCSQLETVTFEEESKLTSIGLNAFTGCSKLTFNTDNDCRYLGSIDNQYLALIYGANKNVVINENCRVIGGSAFQNCSALTSITIPSGVTSIGGSAFSSCSQLETVTFEEGSKLTSIGERAFFYCPTLTNITIPSGVTSIGGSAFYYCSQLETITFEEESKLTSIGEKAFSYCPTLTSITIPSSVTSIGNYAFSGCSQLETVTFEEGSKLTSIGDSAFQNCSALTNITILSGITSIGYSTFDGCSKLQTVTFEEKSQLTLIGERAFVNCSALTNITIPSGVTSIGGSAFSSCLQLETVTFEEESKLTSIGGSAFVNCSALTNITIPSGVTSIGDYAFEDCSSLTKITIPSSVTSIGAYVFSGCSQLQTVDLTALNSVPTLGIYAFLGHNDKLRLYVKTSMLEEFKAAPGWSSYTDNIVPGPVPSINTI